ncbi:carbohydrate binding domain-containing protein, partial [Cellulomonas sp.]|uniref:carbohydrate binding domain-containing protein n=1 Tax=Cellulomonas sp. TaxID=40001 RepID=UPI0028124079
MVATAAAGALVAGVVTPLVITQATAAPGAETVLSLDFDDGTSGDWANNGGTHSYPSVDGNRALQVVRTADYQGIKSPSVTWEAGVEYTFSMRARLVEGTEGTRDLRFVTDPGYTWIGNTTVDATGWTTVTGTYTPEADTASQIFIGSANSAVATEAYGYVVDDILVTRPAAQEPPAVTEVLSLDFDDGTSGDWANNGGTHSYPSVDGNRALQVV